MRLRRRNRPEPSWQAESIAAFDGHSLLRLQFLRFGREVARRERLRRRWDRKGQPLRDLGNELALANEMMTAEASRLATVRDLLEPVLREEQDAAARLGPLTRQQLADFEAETDRVLDGAAKRGWLAEAPEEDE